MTDLSEMRRVAEAATPGPWAEMIEEDREASVFSGVPDRGWVTPRPELDGEGVTDADAIYIATFDPPTVLALLDVVEAAKLLVPIYTVKGSDAGRLRDALSRLESL